MPQLFTNNGGTTLAASLSDSATSATVTTGSVFPAPTGGDVFLATIEAGSAREIVRVTARTGDTLTIVRAQEGTTALAWDAGASIELRLTAGWATAVEAIVAEVLAARGMRSALGLRIDCVSDFASPNAGGVPAVGSWFDQSAHGDNASTLISAAGRIELYPYYTSTPLTIDRIGINVSTAAAGSARVVIYESDANGWPGDRVLSEDVPVTDTTGSKMATVDFTFDSGRKYWLGRHTSAAPTLRGLNVGSCFNMGLTSETATNYATVLRRTITYGDGAPATWEYVNSDRVAGIVQTSIRMRRA